MLHDGEPRGERRARGRSYDVFDELAVLEASSYGTWEVIADCPTEAARDTLAALFDDVDGALEDWTDSVTILCGACSRGEAREHHEPASTGQYRAFYKLVLDGRRAPGMKSPIFRMRDFEVALIANQRIHDKLTEIRPRGLIMEEIEVSFG